MSTRRAALAAALAATLALLLLAPPGRAEEADEFAATLSPFAQPFARRLAAPTVYHIQLDLDPDFLTFTASETIDVTNRAPDPWTEVYLHVYPNASFVAEEGTRNVVIQRAEVEGRAAAFELSGTLLRVPLARPLPPGAATRLRIDWKGILPRQKAGGADLMSQGLDQLAEMLGTGAKEKSGDYGLYAAVAGTVNLALWYPALATYEDKKGWDTRAPAHMGDFGFFPVSNFEVTIRAPADMQIAGSGVQVQEEAAAGGTVARTFRAGFARDFVVQMSRKYRRATRTVDGVTVNSWYLPGDEEGGAKVLDYATGALAVYGAAFGPYAYRELDLVEAHLKGGAGGVEFPGCVTINSMFYPTGAKAALGGGQMQELLRQLGPSLGGLDLEGMLEFTVVHEVAHQWWNAAVGSDSQAHPFIDESLANCSAVLYFERRHGREGADAQIALQLKSPFLMMGLFGGQDAPVDQPATAFANTVQYSAVVYGKGALYLLKLRELAGADAWERAAHEYYRSYFLATAPPRGFTDVVARVSGRAAEVDRLYRHWILETHGVEDIGAEASLLDNPLLKELLGGAGKGVDAKDLKELEELLKELGK